ncbi:Inositol hexakisphosphate kinase 1 [Gonapodya sp. JEL0774]|nr:Inositol hexakisphosphate kinase 1 [Gonapodya sp. JEL0774]
MPEFSTMNMASPRESNPAIGLPLHRNNDVAQTETDQQQTEGDARASLVNYVPFEHQVAGHDRVVLLQDGALAKPTSVSEVEFYSTLQHLAHSMSQGDPSSSSSTSSSLHFMTFVPKFFGTCFLPDHPSLPAVVMENLVRHFRRPCLADFKLGARLYGDDASVEKRRRMEEYSRTTTSGSLGVRLTGAKIWDPSARTYTTLSKHYGRSLTPSTFFMGVRRFFSDENGSLLYGRYAPLVMEKLEHIRRAVEATPSLRLYSTSALVVFEGDLDGLDVEDHLDSHHAPVTVGEAGSRLGCATATATNVSCSRDASVSEPPEPVTSPSASPVSNSRKPTVATPTPLRIPLPPPLTATSSPKPTPSIPGVSSPSDLTLSPPRPMQLVDPDCVNPPSPVAVTPTSTLSHISTLADDRDGESEAAASDLSEQAVTEDTGSVDALVDEPAASSIPISGKMESSGRPGQLQHLVDVRVIDFSHSTFGPWEVPDANFLLGLNNLIEAVRRVAMDASYGYQTELHLCKLQHRETTEPVSCHE